MALSTPQLWSSIRITFDPSLRNGVEIVQRRAKMLHTWLERSGSLPVTADIRRCNQSWSGTVEWETEGRQLVAELLPYSNRWTNLTLYLPYACLSPLWDAMDLRLPQLVTLTIINKDPADRYRMFTDRRIPPPVIKNIPEIRQLSLSLPLLHILSYDIPWSLLTYLSLMTCCSHDTSTLSVDSAASILRECANVVKCHLSIGGGGVVVGGPVIVSRLKSLE